MTEKQCPHYVDSHSCYWCVFKNTENCPKQEQSEVIKIAHQYGGEIIL